jgi:hypothetical protein
MPASLRKRFEAKRFTEIDQPTAFAPRNFMKPTIIGQLALVLQSRQPTQLIIAFCAEVRKK